MAVGNNAIWRFDKCKLGSAHTAFIELDRSEESEKI